MKTGLFRGFPLLILLVLIGCDSSDPIADNTPGAEVAGNYTFEYYTFRPDASALASYNLLDTLVTADTELLLTDSKEFVLTYRFAGGQLRIISGTFRVTNSTVRLTANGGSSDKLQQLLLPETLTLTRNTTDDRILSATYHQTVDLSHLSQYKNVAPFGGTLQITARR